MKSLAERGVLLDYVMSSDRIVYKTTTSLVHNDKKIEQLQGDRIWEMDIVGFNGDPNSVCGRIINAIVKRAL